MALDQSTSLIDPREADPDLNLIGTLWCIRGVEPGWEIVFESAPLDASGNVVEAEAEFIDAFGAANGQWLVIKYTDPSETRAYRVTVEGAGCDQSCPSDWVKARPTEVPLPLPDCDSGTQRPSGNHLVLWWKLDEGHVEPGPWHDPQSFEDPDNPGIFACGVTGETAGRVYLDSSGHNNHGFALDWSRSSNEEDQDGYDPSLAWGATPGVANRGFGSPIPHPTDRTEGSIVVDPSPTVRGCDGGGQRTMEDFFQTHDITTTGWYRPWLWSPDPNVETLEMDEQEIWGRWSFREGDIDVGQTSSTVCTMQTEFGGFYVEMNHLNSPPFTPFIEAHFSWVGHTIFSDPELRHEVNWTGHEIEDYQNLTREQAILGDHWMFLAQRHSPIQPDGTIQIDFFLGNRTTGELSKLCCTDLMDGSDIADACHAPQIREDTAPLHSLWTLGSRGNYEGSRECGAHHYDQMKAHFDDHRRYNEALDGREIRWLFDNPGKA